MKVLDISPCTEGSSTDTAEDESPGGGLCLELLDHAKNMVDHLIVDGVEGPWIVKLNFPNMGVFFYNNFRFWSWLLRFDRFTDLLRLGSQLGEVALIKG